MACSTRSRCRSRGPQTSEAQRIYEALDQIPYAEQQGFDSVWFSEHHFRPVWSHNSAPDLTLAAASQRTSRIRLGIGVVLAPIHHPLHVAQRMATLDILSRGRVDVGIGRTGYPYQLTPYGTDLKDTRGMWQEFADVLPRLWTEEEVSYDGDLLQDPAPRGAAEAAAEAAPATVVGLRQRRDGAADRQPRDGRAVRRRRRPQSRPRADGALSRLAAHRAEPRLGGAAARRADDRRLSATRTRKIAAERGSELVGWYIEQQRERARLVWRDYDPATVPPDYQGYYARDQRLAAGPHPGEPTPREVRDRGEQFCVGTPAECIRFIEMYEALGIEEMILLCAVGPAAHEEVLHTLRLFGEEVIPHFRAKEKRAAAAN